MERPPSLNEYMEQTGLPEELALPDWELALLAFQRYVKENTQ